MSDNVVCQCCQNFSINLQEALFVCFVDFLGIFIDYLLSTTLFNGLSVGLFRRVGDTDKLHVCCFQC